MIVGSVWQNTVGFRKFLATVVLIYYTGLVAAYHPSYLSFFNVASGGAANGHQILTDSNIDWGQDLYQLKAALNKHDIDEEIGLLYFGHVDPKFYGIDYHLMQNKPEFGYVAVSIHFLIGGSYLATDENGNIVNVGREHTAWLRPEVPIARIGSIWLYDTRYLADE